MWCDRVGGKSRTSTKGKLPFAIPVVGLLFYDAFFRADEILGEVMRSHVFPMAKNTGFSGKAIGRLRLVWG
jgi:hypothetical protein